jgi:lysine biosynthesis protein LysW
MANEAVSGTTVCPECFAEVQLSGNLKGEIVHCADCGAEFELPSVDPK